MPRGFKIKPGRRPSSRPRRSGDNTEAIPVRPSSGNVFADLGLPRSAEALAKAEIAIRIASVIERRRLTQAQAAERLGIDQADVSDLVRGKLRGFSTDRLLRFVTALGQDVEIVIHERHHASRPGCLRVRDDKKGSARPRASKH